MQRNTGVRLVSAFSLYLMYFCLYGFVNVCFVSNRRVYGVTSGSLPNNTLIHRVGRMIHLINSDTYFSHANLALLGVRERKEKGDIIM